MSQTTASERTDRGTASGSDDNVRRLAPAVEAILLTSDRPATAQRIAEALGLVPSNSSGESETEAPAGGDSARDPGSHAGAAAARAVVGRVVDHLNAEYDATGRCFRVESVSGGYRLMTLPGVAPVLASFHRTAAGTRLSRAAVETLAIIAYRQPITRAQLEAIRGVGCGEVLRSLMERRLVTIRGRAEELGRPILYGTTREFLDGFGLASLKDLPTPAETLVGP